MRRNLVRLLRPKWVGFHLLAWGAAVAMVFLGRWQLDVSNRKHFDLQNFGYTLQWWAFTAAALIFWGKVMYDQLRKTPPATISTSGEIVRTGKGLALPVDYSGPAQLVTQAKPGAEPVVYRGYRMPQSSDAPARAGDEFHGSYNDYLWQLSLADQAEAAEKARRDDSG